MNQNKTIIDIKNLQVTFGNIRALDINKNIVINEGDIVGIIGENGSGKSTLINSIINQVQYSGSIECNFLKGDLGIQFQDNSFNKLMKVYELIQIVTNKSKYDDEIKELFDEFDLNPILKNRIGKLSGGEKQRLTLFLVLYLKPKIMIFDELTTGLDFQKRSKLLKIVKDYSKGKTVLSISHYFEELNNWVNKLIILYKGKLCFFGTIEELRNKYPHEAIFKIKKQYRSVVNNIFNKEDNINILNDFNEEVDAVIINKFSDKKFIIDKLMSKNIGYDMEACSIYSLYALVINDVKGSE